MKSQTSKKTCSFCSKESIASCNFIKHTGEVVEIQGCDAHLQIALLQQEQVASMDNLSQRLQNFGRNQIIMSSNNA